jgi:CHRD domain
MLVTRRVLAVLVLAVALAAAALFALPAGANDATGPRCTLFTVLKPGNEVPPSTSLAFGAAVVRIDGATLRFAVVIANGSRETFVAGHIHQEAAGVNGPVVVPLFSSTGVSPLLFVQTDTLEISSALAGAICANPANYYINYHTTARPSGTTRGQLG